ncbi:MAG: hypothetical protein AVDCRST_MAG76-2209, partial [uncultured Acidimicrobiales bacterium]
GRPAGRPYAAPDGHRHASARRQPEPERPQVRPRRPAARDDQLLVLRRGEGSGTGLRRRGAVGRGGGVAVRDGQLRHGHQDAGHGLGADHRGGAGRRRRAPPGAL